ncbi:putative colanic acid biosynthesis acetyltransferase [Aestuariibaculum sp. YM273]|uniref:putative colanic acid biosynthesis acetyltransferase n=1 Tax=Aestuariibaculum sp. YM273 TaxID=3070659 RepID=UPI0027DE3982|nr:putative colanic acid biosynthesis acetyltransferase [Aestuariibaculum sp. YM273]WMI66625.1 putative colanic acid biosynthesis acetyltransferase [Aestuariibaculum sp. YM273]
MQNLNMFKMPGGFRGKSPIFVQIWWFVQATLFAWSPQFLYGWRRFLLRCFGAKVGKGVIVRPSVKITYPWKVSIGDYSWIGDEVVLYSLGEIEIGSNTVISQRSYICTGSHDYSKMEFPIHANKIIIEDGCWLATDVFVTPGVLIEKGTVVGARSSVFKNLNAFSVYAGSPAKFIKIREIE